MNEGKNGVPVEEWIERQYAIFVTLLSWVRIQSRTPGFFIHKNHYKSIYIYLRGMWWHDDVLNHWCIRNPKQKAEIPNISVMDV